MSTSDEDISGNITVQITDDLKSYIITDDGLLSSLRHRIKNKLNFLTLAEYELYGNNDIIKSLAKDVDIFLEEEFFFDRIVIDIEHAYAHVTEKSSDSSDSEK